MSEEHAEDTAKFLNVIQPERIWMIGLKIWNDTDLYKQYNQGLFVPLDLRSRNDGSEKNTGESENVRTAYLRIQLY